MEPRENPDLAGHHAARGALEDAARSGRLHHAWLLGGPAGIGKATLAFRFARWLLAGMPATKGLELAPDHPVFRRVAAGSHADVLTVDRFTDPDGNRKRHTQVVAAAARLIPPFLSLTPAEGGWRVVVLDDADTMEAASANAVLKVIEEPPPRTLILLVAASPFRLLPTLRSRCRRLDLAPLGAAELEGVLRARLPDLDGAALAALAARAQGSPGRALALADGGGAALLDLAERALAEAGGAAVRPRRLAEAALKHEDGANAFLVALADRLGLALRRAARGQPDRLAEGLLRHRPGAAWAETHQALVELAERTAQLNLDPRGAIMVAIGLVDGRIPPQRIAI